LQRAIVLGINLGAPFPTEVKENLRGLTLKSEHYSSTGRSLTANIDTAEFFLTLTEYRKLSENE